MTEKIAIVENMKANGYATQYTAEELAEMYDLDTIKRFEKKFFEYLAK